MRNTPIHRPRRLKGIGLTGGRKRRPGPEHELVDQFIRGAPFPVPRGCRVTLFREPRLESGFPDLVIVLWSEAVARRWAPCRAALTTADIRLMQLLVTEGPLREQEILSVFSRDVSQSLERLCDAQMIHKSRGAWAHRSLASSFAARQIIAVEAKISEWSGALEQAFLNTWFASASYVLVPHAPRGSMLLANARQRGVGVWTASEELLRVRPSKDPTLPRSYASWLFNEWAWRAACLESGFGS